MLLGLVLLTGCGEPETALPPVEEAREQLRRGDALAAQISLERALGEGKSRKDLAALFGEAALAAGDPVTARSWLEPGEFSPETRALGFRNLGRLEMSEGKLQAAAAAFDQSYRSDPDSADLWVDIARLRYRGGEQLRAIDAVSRALTLDPENAQALLFHGQLISDAKGLAAGAAVLDRALERHPDNVDLRVEYAATLGDSGRAGEALEVLRGGHGQAAATGRGLYLQAVIAARGEQYRLAGDLLDRSGLAEADVPAAQLLAAIVDLAEENYSGAALRLDRLHAAQPDNRRITDLFGFALSRAGQDRELVNRLGPVALSPAGSVYLRILIGRSLESLGERNLASRFLDLAAREPSGLVVLPGDASFPVALPLRDADALRDYVRKIVGSGTPAIGLAPAREFARLLPGSPDVASLLGDLEMSAGNRSSARDAYRKAGLVRQSWPLVLRRLATADNPSAGERFLADYMRSNPMNSDAAVLLADAAARKNEWSRAVRLLDHALALGQGRTPAVLAARSVGALKLERPKEALQFALAAHELQPMNPLAIAALIAALPQGEHVARLELEAKLESRTVN